MLYSNNYYNILQDLILISVAFIELVIKQLFESLDIKLANCLYNCNVSLL